jgi:hypothetical protein
MSSRSRQGRESSLERKKRRTKEGKADAASSFPARQSNRMNSERR